MSQNGLRELGTGKEERATNEGDPQSAHKLLKSEGAGSQSIQGRSE